MTAVRPGPAALACVAGLALVAGPAATGAALAGPAASRPLRAGSHALGPPAGHTGGFGEPTCLECHIGSEPNTPGSTLAAVGLDSGFRPGEPLVVTIRLDSFDMLAAGFQAAFRHAEGARAGARAGTVRPLDGRVAVVDSAGIAYVQQTSEGARADGEHAEWRFEWTPPEAGGAVALHVAANSANGDNSPLEDLVYTLALRLEARTASAGDPTAPLSAAPSASRDR